MTQPSRFARFALALPVAFCIAAAPAASAQLPGGISPDAVQGMIPSEISVPAGQTTSVDVGVPVNVAYNSGGWSVSSSGTVVTVTAPNEEGATAAVTASAGGYSATVNLVAVGGGDTDGAAPGRAPASEGESGTPGESAGQPGGGAGPGQQAPSSGPGGAAAVHPPRKPAERVDTATAKRFDFDGEIHGNELVVKVPLSKARDLLNYANVDTENAKLRYVDINGQIIEGVQRDINVAGRTLTLTYPEGETPDNPFIMEVVRDGKAEFIAVITATNAEVEQPGGQDEDNPYGEYAGSRDQGSGVDGGSSASNAVPLVVAGTALLAAIALLIVFLRHRRRG